MFFHTHGKEHAAIAQLAIKLLQPHAGGMLGMRHKQPVLHGQTSGRHSSVGCSLLKAHIIDRRTVAAQSIYAKTVGEALTLLMGAPRVDSGKCIAALGKHSVTIGGDIIRGKIAAAGIHQKRCAPVYGIPLYR